MMKTVLRITLIFLLSINSVHIVTAQRGPKRTKVAVHKTKNGRVTVVRKTKFRRKNVIVVRRRNVRSVTVLPIGYNTIIFKNKTYYFHSGRYYLLRNSVYEVVPPPSGIRVSSLPIENQSVIVNQVNYYYFDGTFYQKDSAGYQVVKAPIGAVVSNLPEDNEEITIDGVTYYEYNNYLYKKVDNAYELMGKLED